MTTTMKFKTGTVYQLPPGELLLERNIRTVQGNTALQELADSIAQHGVLEPITAVVNNAGAPVVRFGHRRTVAAIAAGQVTVPVFIAGADDTEVQSEINRVLAQRDENTLRAGLTAAEEVELVEQLVAFGMSADEIAEQGRIAKERIESVSAVSKSPLAKKAAQKYTALTLDQAAAIAEFEDDAETFKSLTVVALERPAAFPHELQRARDERARAVKRAATIAEIEAGGATYTKDRPGYGTRTTRLDHLQHSRGGKPVSLDEHKTCAGHVGWVDYNSEAEYGCADPKKYGHHDRYSNTKPAASEMSEEEREKAKAARRLVIENNKAWISAETVRRIWLGDLARGTKAPKGAAAFIAIGLTKDRHQLAQYDSTPGELVADWLKVKKPAGGWDLTPHLKNASADRALLLALVQVLANYESHLTKDSWRGDGTSNGTGRYLRYLESIGYPLSDVERVAIGKAIA